MRKPVSKFAEAMESKLQEKDAERGVDGWLSADCSLSYLLDRIKDEYNELDHAFINWDEVAMLRKAVDIANFAMMVHSKIIADRDSEYKKWRKEYGTTPGTTEDFAGIEAWNAAIAKVRETVKAAYGTEESAVWLAAMLEDELNELEET